MAEKSDDLKTREEKITQARELYCRGSRNYLVKCYSEAADDLSQVCALYEELYGPMADELGMPYLLYAKSLLSLALVENKVIDVPDEENDDEENDEADENEEPDENEADKPALSSETEMNGDVKKTPVVVVETDKKVVEIEKDVLKNVEEKDDEKMKPEDLTMNKKHKDDVKEKETEKEESKEDNVDNKTSNKDETSVQTAEGSKEKLIDVPSSNSKKSDIDDKKIEDVNKESNGNDAEMKKEKPQEETTSSASKEPTPGTSNGQTHEDGDEDGENDSAPTLQVAWETLELAGKIFERQGESALANLAEVKAELGNIQFENSVLESAREDYNAALEIYKKLEPKYRRAMAEIHYKIGLTYFMPELQSYKSGAAALKEACTLLDEEIKEMRNQSELTSKDKLIIEDLEETRQEIWMKITEIEESQQQCLAEVRAGLDNYMHPSKDPEIAGPSSSVSPEKPVKDISHLIKRKKPETAPDTEASPAKRPAL